MGGLGRADEYGYAVPLVRVAPLPNFEELLRRHASDLRGFVARRVSDIGLVDDIVQETLLRAYRARDDFDRTRPVWPWLAVIARNTVSNALRGERSRRRHLERDFDWRAVEGYADQRLGADPETRLASKEQRASIVQALDGLDDRQRRLLLMRASDGLAYDEIARLEGLSLDAVKSLLKRARRSFRETYEGLGREYGAPGLLLPRLRRLRLSLRVRYSRVRTRADYAVYAARCSTGFESLVQVVGAVGVAGALLLGAFASNSNPAAADAGHHAAPAYEPIAGEGGGAASHHRFPATPGQPLLHQSIAAGPEGGRASISLAGNIDRARRERRSLRIHIDYEVPGRDQGVDTWADVPCAVNAVHSPVCDMADTVAGNPEVRPSR